VLETNPVNIAVPAVVVGLCAHGLALTRALHREGVSVFALEKNRTLPGLKTSSAAVHFVDDIDGDSLVKTLIQFAIKNFPTERPVLFLTNDNMTAAIARQVDQVRQYYRLSWADCAERTARLLDKSHIEIRCREAGLSYPLSQIVKSIAEFAGIDQHLEFPVIVKPSKPLSSFKTIVIKRPEQVSDALSPHIDSAPFLVQEFIPGDDTSISFCALYLEQGSVVAHFEGRKLQSRPMGHTTIAIPSSDPELLAHAKKFFSGLDLSGPVSLEIKRDANGTMWVIEPTVGRTDFWVGLCINAGISLPMIEYRAQTGQSTDLPSHFKPTIWVNGERDPLAIFRLLTLAREELWRSEVCGVYFDWSDMKPWCAQVLLVLRRQVTTAPRRISRKISDKLRRRRGAFPKS
jgi:D-aspartate ligase